MKRLFILTSAISLIGCYLLHFKFRYSFTVIAYHLLLVLLIHGGVFAINVLFSAIRKPRLRAGITNAFNYIFLFLFVVFYLLIIVSNLFWGKTITFRITSNYVRSIDSLINILPVKPWIFYSVLLLVLCIITGLFLLVKPVPNKIYTRYRPALQNRKYIKLILTSLVMAALLIFIFRSQLMYVKRRIHFSEEPLFQFVLGPMWNAHAFPLAFDNERFKLGLKDQNCTDSIKVRDATTNTPTIVVILLDALRPDHLSLYGYPRKNTPYLDSLALTSNLHVVKKAFSTSNMTSGGVAGLFYSRDWEDFGYNGLSLLKFMKKINYKTYAFLTGFHRDWYDLSALYRNNCDYYYESAINPYANNDDDLPTLKEFNKHTFQRNSFIYIHLLSTHTIGKKNSQFRKFLPDKIDLGVSTKTAVTNNYDNGVLQGDYVIGEILNKLRRDDPMQNFIVYIVADHGEMLGEDGRWSHGGNIHPMLLEIPLIIYDKDSTFYNNLESATIKDIAPTIADRLQYEIPSCWEGRSLHMAPGDFTMKVNSGIRCEFPKGIITKKDSVYTVQIMDENNTIRKTAVMPGHSKSWKDIPGN